VRKARDGAPAHRGVDHGGRMRQRAEAVKAGPNLFGPPRRGCLLCPLSSAETHHLVSPANVGRGGVDAMIVQRWERSPETSVNILSYAGFHQHDRSFVWGCPGLDAGVDRNDRPQRQRGNSPCRGFAPAVARDLLHRTLPRCGLPVLERVLSPSHELPLGNPATWPRHPRW